MKAFYLTRYGSADNLELREIDTPTPAADEVLVRVRATSVNPYDWHHMRGEPVVARFLPGGPAPRRPRFRVLGCDVAGAVEAVGRDVSGFAPGDRVVALADAGGFAEYATVPARRLVKLPTGLSYEHAAALPMAGLTALVALRDAGRGGRILVNGASGGVGTFAVRLASAAGATVTGVCRAANGPMVRELGAADVIDYRTADFTRGDRRWDVLIDIAGSHPGRAYRRVLADDGVIVVVGGKAGRWVQPAGHAIGTVIGGTVARQRVVLADVLSAPDQPELLASLVGDRVPPVIDRGYAFAELPAAVRYQEAGHAAGKVIVMN